MKKMIIITSLSIMFNGCVGTMKIAKNENGASNEATVTKSNNQKKSNLINNNLK